MARVVKNTPMARTAQIKRRSPDSSPVGAAVPPFETEEDMMRYKRHDARMSPAAGRISGEDYDYDDYDEGSPDGGPSDDWHSRLLEVAKKSKSGEDLKPRPRKPPIGGKWHKEEDDKLRTIVETHGAKNWKKIAELLGTTRTDVQCLHRWNKVLRPGLAKGPWTEEEDNIVKEMVLGAGVANVKWSAIAQQLGGLRRRLDLRHRLPQAGCHLGMISARPPHNLGTISARSRHDLGTISARISEISSPRAAGSAVC